MPRPAALPFLVKRSHDVIGRGAITSTQEQVHGLLRLEPDRLVIQWRVARTIDQYGPVIRSDHELEPLREVAVPLHGLAGARVRIAWWRWGRGARLVLTAADLDAFAPVAGEAGFRSTHPAELILRIRASNRQAAREFVGDLNLALAEQALRLAEGREEPRAPDGSARPPADRLGP